jgi:hypothetical protein
MTERVTDPCKTPVGHLLHTVLPSSAHGDRKHLKWLDRSFITYKTLISKKYLNPDKEEIVVCKI